MTEIDFNIFIDKLAFQVKSFQENFAYLSQSRSVEELGKKFSQVLRGNLFISDISILYKKKVSEEWVSILLSNPKCEGLINDIKLHDTTHIDFFESGDFKIIAVIPLVDNSFFVLFCGERIGKGIFTEPDRITLQMFIQLLDSSYQSLINHKKEKQLIFSLNHRVLQLNTLIDTGIEISRLQRINSLLELALERAVSLTNASYGMLETLSNDGMTNKLYFPTDGIDEVFKTQNKISTSVKFNDVEYVLTLAEKESRDADAGFDETDKTLLTAFARQVLTSLENEFLHREALEGERMHKEIEMAAAIQKRIIPQALPEIEGYKLSGINIPSLEIGGDYYDVVKLKNNKYLLIIADVAGKGVSSGLLVNSLNASLNAYLENDFELKEIAKRLNRVIFKASTPEKYITAFIAILNPETSELEYVNAGHNPIYVAKGKRLLKLNRGGMSFGMFDMDLPYETETIQMDINDRILFYTDGITEAMNAEGEEYSDEKLEEYFINNDSDEPHLFLKNLVASLKEHTKDTPQSDDITALYLIRN